MNLNLLIIKLFYLKDRHFLTFTCSLLFKRGCVSICKLSIFTTLKREWGFDSRPVFEAECCETLNVTHKVSLSLLDWMPVTHSRKLGREVSSPNSQRLKGQVTVIVSMYAEQEELQPEKAFLYHLRFSSNSTGKSSREGNEITQGVHLFDKHHLCNVYHSLNESKNIFPNRTVEKENITSPQKKKTKTKNPHAISNF